MARSTRRLAFTTGLGLVEADLPIGLGKVITTAQASLERIPTLRGDFQVALETPLSDQSDVSSSSELLVTRAVLYPMSF